MMNLLFFDEFFKVSKSFTTFSLMLDIVGTDIAWTLDKVNMKVRWILHFVIAS